MQQNAPMAAVPAAAVDSADSVNTPRFTEKDVDELHEVFPNVTKEVITSVLIEKVCIFLVSLNVFGGCFKCIYNHLFPVGQQGRCRQCTVGDQCRIISMYITSSTNKKTIVIKCVLIEFQLSYNILCLSIET